MDEIKERTINGKKYGFDHNGAMVAEWSVDVEEASKQDVDILASASTAGATRSFTTGKYAQQWRYFQSVEDGSKLSRGWFKVVSAEYLNEEKYDDDEEAWYYADGKGDLYAGEFRTINGKKYAFRDDGRMISGLVFIDEDDANDHMAVVAWDNDAAPFDTEDEFLVNAPYWEAQEYKLYYFGDGEDGSMKTGKTTVSIDGESFTFSFEKSGSKKGEGTTGEDDDKYYQSGMLLAAGSDEKYQILKPIVAADMKNDFELDDVDADFKAYGKYEDFDDFKANSGLVFVKGGDIAGEIGDDVDARDYVRDKYDIDVEKLNKDGEDITELYVIDWEKSVGCDWEDFKIINKSGKVVDNDTRVTDGEDYTYVTGDNGKIMAIYVED